MPPRRKQPKIVLPEIPEGQSPLIGAEYAHSGLTEPGSPPIRAEIGAVYSNDAPTPEDVLPKAPPAPNYPSAITPQGAAVDAVFKHSRAQTGSHSAIDPTTGLYEPWAGSVLPGFGIVTYSNLDSAMEHAQALNKKILANQHKSVTEQSDNPLTKVIAEVAGKLSMDAAIAAPEPTTESERMVESETESKTRPELPPFGSVERILALRDAKWAGFLPTTNTEKNDGFKLLQELETELGVHNFLMSIYYHTKRVERNRVDEMTGKRVRTYYETNKLAHEAVISVVYEMGDKLLGSMAEYDELEKLNEIVAQTDNPSLTLGELIKDEKIDLRRAAAGAVRYIDTRQVYNHELDLPFTPFTDREQRPPARPLPGKNKTVMDPFTAALLIDDDKMEMVRGYVLGRMDEITVKDLRSVVPTLMSEDMVRGNYWLQVLIGVTGSYKKYAEYIFDELDNQAAASKVQ